MYLSINVCMCVYLYTECYTHTNVCMCVYLYTECYTHSKVSTIGLAYALARYIHT